MDRQINQAVILAGGRGERLRPITNSIPKPMAPINGVPFMHYLLYSLINVGISKILILLGYKSSVIYKEYINMNNIAIVGLGVVGSAIYNYIDKFNFFSIIGYDKYKNIGNIKDILVSDFKIILINSNFEVPFDIKRDELYHILRKYI